MKKKVRISVLVSGGGSNLQSLIDAYKDSETCEIVQVISRSLRPGKRKGSRNSGIYSRQGNISRYEDENG